MMVRRHSDGISSGAADEVVILSAALVKCSLDSRSFFDEVRYGVWWVAHKYDEQLRFYVNKWLCHDSKLLKDGDRIRALRLRTNLYPTRPLTNKQITDPA